MTQSRRMSLVEAAANVVVGYALAVTTQIMVFPWFGLHPSLGENMAIGALFTGISLLRGYALFSGDESRSRKDHREPPLAAPADSGRD